MRAVTLALVLSAAAVASVRAQWPQWRGPNRDGVVRHGVGALRPGRSSRCVRWKQAVGEGYSTPVVAGDRVFVHSRRDPDEIVSAFDLATGSPLWSTRYPAPFSKNQYARPDGEGTRFSPRVFHDGRIFTLGDQRHPVGLRRGDRRR